MERVLALLLFVVGCTGMAPNPVAMYQPGDEHKNCASLRMEIESIDLKIAIRGDIKKAKHLSNFIKLASTYSLLIPWLFVDLKDAEQIEIEALQQRKKVVLVLAAEKGCSCIKQNRKVGVK